jgi:hypothetical protein
LSVGSFLTNFILAEVYEDNRIRINFDGWTSTFDYTVETDNSDIHPCGYWEYVQRVLYKNVNMSKLNPHFTFTRYDRPKCKYKQKHFRVNKLFAILAYDSPFTWRNYLTELNQEPVPFECFNYVRNRNDYCLVASRKTDSR